MKYMGSKRRIAKHILPIMLSEAEKRGITKWVEPFVGGANLIDKVPSSFERVGYDLNPHAIQALIDIRDNVDYLPEMFTKEQRDNVRNNLVGIHLKSWAEIVTSFGSDLKGGYAMEKGSDETTFCGYGRRNALKQSPLIQGVNFICDSYENLSFKDSLIYCDPPYANTSGYKTGAFNHAHFFEWCKEQAKTILFLCRSMMHHFKKFGAVKLKQTLLVQERKLHIMLWSDYLKCYNY